MLATLTLAALLPVLLPTSEAHGEGSPCDGSTPTVPSGNNYALPPWSDGGGWAHPDQYKTILNGDVNGDDVGDLVGRNAHHMEVWTWAGNYASVGAGGAKAYDPPPGQWAPIAPVAGATMQTFATEDGWWDPSLYSTFRLADVDGNKGDELVVRTRAGIYIYKFNTSTRTWDEPFKTGCGPTNRGGARVILASIRRSPRATSTARAATRSSRSDIRESRRIRSPGAG